MRVALITAIAKQVDALQSFLQESGLSLGPFYLESYLKKYGPVVDCHLVQTLDQIFELKPDLVGISAVTENYAEAISLARCIKQKLSIPVVIGGVHVSVLPESLHPVFDVAVIGEGEETFRQLLLAKKAGQWGPEAFAAIEGLAYRQAEVLQKTKARKPISPIDIIPKPERVAWASSVGAAHIVSSRGCPFTCAFCTESEGVSRYRSFSVETMVAEIEDLVNHFGVKCVTFFDDVFNIDLKKIKLLSKTLRERGLHEKVVFNAWARASILNEEMVQALKEMNVHTLAFGFESGSDRLLSKIKVGTKVADNERAIALCKKAGINVSGAFIIGLPGETLADLQATYAFIEKYQSDFLQIEISPFVPLPGSSLWKWAESKGHVSTTHTQWEKLKDWSAFHNFKVEDYRFLNESMTLAEFSAWVPRFKAIHQKICNNPGAIKMAQELFPNLSKMALKNRNEKPLAKVA